MEASNLDKKSEDLQRYLSNNDYDQAILTINEIMDIHDRPEELSDMNLMSLQASLYLKKGDLEEAYNSIKSAFIESDGNNKKINKELVDISSALFNKIFNNFKSNKKSEELFKIQYYLIEIRNLVNKENQTLQLSDSYLDIKNIYQEVGMKYIIKLIENRNINEYINECELFIDNEYLKQNFIKNEYKVTCIIIKGSIYSSRNEYAKAFDIVYNVLKYNENIIDEYKKNYLERITDYGIKVYRQYTIEKNFEKAEESYNKVIEIVTDDKLLNKFKMECFHCILDLNRWEEAYKLNLSLNIQLLEEEEKERINELKVKILINLISEKINSKDSDKCKEYLNQFFDLDSSMSFDTGIELFIDKLYNELENGTYNEIISIIDEILNKKDKNKYKEFHLCLEKLNLDIPKGEELNSKENEDIKTKSKSKDGNMLVSSKTKIFGQKFVNNNKNKCKIKYKNKDIELKEYLEDFEGFDAIHYNHNSLIQFTLTGFNNINDISYMFEGCNLIIDNALNSNDLEKVAVSNDNTIFDNMNNNIEVNDKKTDSAEQNDIYDMCRESPIPPINKVSNTSIFSITTKNNIFDYYTFYICDSRLIIPHISKWDLSKITNISYIFSSCQKIISLPDISNWNIKNVTDISGMFYGCSSLISLPDISNWNTIKVKYMNSFFDGCNALLTLPDITSWNTSNVIKMDKLMNECFSLRKLSDISKWNTSKVKDMSYMFNECLSLTSLPDISKWNTMNVQNMSYMFCNCNSLISLPDLSKWNTNNLKEKTDMFKGSEQIKNIPEKFK